MRTEPDMTARELAELVARMRHAQTEYFRTRSDSALKEAKKLEKTVDRCCEIILDDQKHLFERG